MVYLFCEDAGKEELRIRGEDFKYLIKVRRHKVGDTILFRNKKERNILTAYELREVGSREASFVLLWKKEESVRAQKRLHIGWCVIDNKSIEKVLASLNEMGVAKISFIYCERSQKNFKPDTKRFERIVDASCQQCGRSEPLAFEFVRSLEAFIEQNPQTKVFDFTDKTLECESDFDTVLIGCEGGFSPKEKELLSSQEVFRLNTPMILRSESAAVAVAAKILL